MQKVVLAYFLMNMILISTPRLFGNLFWLESSWKCHRTWQVLRCCGKPLLN